jgi:cyclopropane fatty-acyl-phospholipid synthase-like methyltransferase
MTNEYLQIKDNCRKGLLKYLAQAFSLIPKIEKPKILDLGCGTGVPAIWLAENYSAKITAIDTDKNALGWLKAKIIDKNLENQITTLNIPFFDLKSNLDNFDIILAEGFLNVVGFERGFSKAIGMLGIGKYFIIHVECRNHEKKCDFISQNQCKLMDTLFLDEKVWWNDYYMQLETEINAMKNHQIRVLFKPDIQQIEWYKTDPSPFRSMYYLVRKLQIFSLA